MDIQFINTCYGKEIFHKIDISDRIELEFILAKIDNIKLINIRKFRVQEAAARKYRSKHKGMRCGTDYSLFKTMHESRIHIDCHILLNAIKNRFIELNS